MLANVRREDALVWHERLPLRPSFRSRTRSTASAVLVASGVTDQVNRTVHSPNMILAFQPAGMSVAYYHQVLPDAPI